MTGRESIHLLDPTLSVSREEWKNILNITEKKDNYILSYFLDTPSEFAKAKMKELQEELDCPIINIPYEFEDNDYFDKQMSAGPKEFVSLILNARLVCTDSFHGTVFSLNLHTPFYIFERMYGTATKQSVRITSLLSQFSLMERYQQVNPVSVVDNIDFEAVDKILETERVKTYRYLQNAIANIKSNEK